MPSSGFGRGRAIFCLATNCLLLLGLVAAVPTEVANADDLARKLAPMARGIGKLSRGICHSLKIGCGKTAKPVSRRPGNEAAKAVTTQPHTGSAKGVHPRADLVPPLPGPGRSSDQAVPNNPATPRQKPGTITDTQPNRTTAAPAARQEPDRPTDKAPLSQVADLPAPDAAPSETSADCLTGLRNVGVIFDTVTQPFGEARCRVDVPVRLHAVPTATGIVNLPESPIFNCQFANQFSRWVTEAGSAVVLAQRKKQLIQISTGPGYDCRGRNGDATDKVSEHGYGDAVDITSMTTADGATIRTADAANPSSPSYSLLRALRTTACGYFTTVLGPGANEAHKEHFHFDNAIHGRSGSYRICE